MFRGHSERNLDPKGRLMLPPEYRDEVLRHSPEGKLMLTNLDGCVTGYPMPVWEEIEQSFQKLNVIDPRVRNFQRFFISGAVEVVLDKQGRILIPPFLRSYAKLGHDCVLAGVGRKIELWDKDAFLEGRRLMEQNFEQDMAAMGQAGLQMLL